MSRVARLRFDDIDQLGEATRHARVEFCVTKGAGYRGRLVVLEAEGLGIQWGVHAAATFTQGEVSAPMFLAGLGTRVPARCNGQPVARGVLFYPAGQELQGTTDEACSWVSVSVPGLAALGAILAPDLALGPGSRLRYADGTRRPVLALRSLLQELYQALDAGADGPQEAATVLALRDDLGTALLRAIAEEAPQRRPSSSAHCSALVRRADEYLSGSGWQPVSVSALCAALGVGEAALREAFQRVYRVGPSRYLRLRRLHLVRRKLRSTTAEACAVSAAAASLGFYGFGRFAGEYRALFGELPSRTVRLR